MMVIIDDKIIDCRLDTFVMMRISALVEIMFSTKVFIKPILTQKQNKINSIQKKLKSS